MPITHATVASDPQAPLLTDTDWNANHTVSIENADVAANAAIDASKIADGSVSNTEFQYLNGVTSAIQTQLDSKGTGDVVGPASSTDNAIVRFDSTTGKLLQNSTATLDDNGVLSTTSVNVTGTNGNGHIHLKHQASDASATGSSTVLFANSSGDLKYKNDGGFYTTFTTSANTADRNYTFSDASGTIPLKGTFVANQIAYASDTNTVGVLDTATYPSLTELSYVKGVTSAIQTQLNAKGAGTVTTVSVATANGFAGTVANASTTPAITLTTSITGVLKGNGTAISAAVSGTDYAPATSGSAILKGNGSGGFSSAVSGTDYAPATTGSSILKASSGGFANAVSGTDYAPATSGTSILKGNGSGGFSNASAGTDYATKTGTNSPTECFVIACSDETTALTTGTAKVTFRMPYAFTLTAVRASVTTAPTGGTLLTIDINETGSTILSTKITIDASEKTSTTAATPPVISDSSLADDAEITIDIDAVGSTIAGAGLKVYLIGYKT